MSCYHPVEGYRSIDVNRSTGKRGIVFSPLKGYRDLPMKVPCGRCIGCLLDRAKNWAVRCVHEASLHKDNCFITLTYNSENLPPGGSLNPRDFTLFMKRLRKRLGIKISFFQCGEYGNQLERPHHHCIIFGWRPDDLVLYKQRGQVKLYLSPLLAELWNKGFVTVGEVTYESAAYIARYVLKKVTGDRSEEHYKGKVPEYITMSRRPGIGKLWLEKYHNEVYKEDTIVYGLGRLTKPPRYYDKLYEKKDPGHFKEIQDERIRREVNAEYNTKYRLEVREKVAKARTKWLEREIH